MSRDIADVRIWIATALASAVLASTGRAQDKADPLQQIKDEPGLPRVLLIGDSISIGYTLPVREALRGKANVHRPPTNCTATVHGLRDLDLWLGAAPWDVVHFNWGLHDLKYIDSQWKITDVIQGRQATMKSEYDANLRALVRRLRQTGARMIWCSTTPVPEGCVGRIPEDVETYNASAAKIMKQENILINDLYSFANQRLMDIQRQRDVHFNDVGYRLLGKEVARSIEIALTQRASLPAKDEHR